MKPNFNIVPNNLQIKKCQAIVFNLQGNLMIAGCGSSILVYQFNQGCLTLVQELNQHQDDVLTLYFSKLKNQFISGSKDASILIWKMSNDQKWSCCYQLPKAHSSDVKCLIMNKNEDLLISAGKDKLIKFWMKNENWECIQIYKGHSGWVWSLNINDSSNQLISCAFCNQNILITQLCKDNKWRKQQIIKVKFWGFRVSYILDDLFVFQSFNGNVMEIFKFNHIQQLFIKYHEINVKRGYCCNYSFPMIYNKKQKIILNKNGTTVNLIQVKQEFEIIQMINFESVEIVGSMTEDGQYIVIWEGKTNQIQVLSYQIQTEVI